MNEERAQEAVEHLQRAALELIHAARAALDVAEELVREPSGMATVVASFLGSVARDAEPATSDEPSPGVTRIRVS